MKSIVTKKTFSQLVDTSENPTEEFYFPSTRKHIKKDLSIEITDSFADPSHVKTPRMSLQLSPSLDIQCGDYPVQTPRHGKRPTLFSSRNQQAFSFNFETEPEKALCHNTTTTSSHDYDDFYLKGAFYDVTMRRCNRKTMEDRVTLLFFLKLIEHCHYRQHSSQNSLETVSTTNSLESTTAIPHQTSAITSKRICISS